MIREQDQTRTLAEFQPLNGSSNVQMARMPMNQLARTSLNQVGRRSAKQVARKSTTQLSINSASQLAGRSTSQLARTYRYPNNIARKIPTQMARKSPTKVVRKAGKSPSKLARMPTFQPDIIRRRGERGGERREGSAQHRSVLRDIRRLQRTTNLLIPKVAFQRLVKEVAANIDSSLRFQSAAIGALHEAGEAFLVERLSCAGEAATHAKRATLKAADLRLVTVIKQRSAQT